VSNDLYATLRTSEGDIVIQLLPNHAPKTVKNFTGLADGSKEWTNEETGERQTGKRFYDGIGFHRVIEDFMLQGGCPLGTGTGGPGYTFDDEIHPELSFKEPYVLAMANAGKRAGKGTNGSQFFITTVPTQWLQGKHTIFGKVADDESRAVVDKINKVPTDAGDRPIEPVVILGIDIDER
jgi:peptidyl-prolyl cis-trans isomerase A (cyclophilin A)